MTRQLTHARIWTALDMLAMQHGLSASGLAKAAGLDPTSFNKSKRFTPAGRPRWPSTESLSRVLEATGASLDEFLALVEGGETAGEHPHRVPLIGFAQAGRSGFFDDAGFPVGGGWEDIAFPAMSDPNAYALEISGDSMEPVYREGDIIIVSPNATPRRGDRVVAKTADGQVLAKVLGRRTQNEVELLSLNPAYETITVPAKDMLWLARILWASQ